MSSTIHCSGRLGRASLGLAACLAVGACKSGGSRPQSTWTYLTVQYTESVVSFDRCSSPEKGAVFLANTTEGMDRLSGPFKRPDFSNLSGRVLWIDDDFELGRNLGIEDRDPFDLTDAELELVRESVAYESAEIYLVRWSIAPGGAGYTLRVRCANPSAGVLWEALGTAVVTERRVRRKQTPNDWLIINGEKWPSHDIRPADQGAVATVEGGFRDDDLGEWEHVEMIRKMWPRLLRHIERKGLLCDA